MMEALAVFLLGICVGSFLNVCIHRFPRGGSMVRPPSHCPHCEKRIGWYDNVPLLSYVLLRGRCRSCGGKIAIRYLLVEFLTGGLWVSLWFIFKGAAGFYAGAVLFSILLAVTVTDLETGYIPDKFTFFGMFAGILSSVIFPSLQGQVLWYRAALHSFYGLLAGGAVLFVIGVIGNLIFKKESMGGGDIKLLAMLGAFLGVQKVILVFFASPFIAMPFALYAKFIRKEETIPYGPYIAAAGAWCFIWGGRFLQNVYFLNYLQ